jgi:GAF domain
MTEPSRPTYQAIVQAAVEATGSTGGWLLAVDDEAFTVLAVYGHGGGDSHDGHDSPPGRVGERVAADGAAGFVATSGQPAAMQISADDADNAGAGGGSGIPSAILAVPCGTEEVVGVIELVDPAGGAYSFDDVEVISMLADVAGAAMTETGAGPVPPSPAALALGLERLAASDSGRYAAVARSVESLL